MVAVERQPDNILQVGGAIFGILTYMASYRAVFEPFVPGGPPVQLQVGILGLVVLGLGFTLMYLSSLRSMTVREYER